MAKSNINYVDVRVAVQRDSSERLLNEAVLAQTATGKDELEKLTREGLVDLVTLLRLTAGGTESVKSVIADFDVKKAKEKFKPPVGAKEKEMPQTEMGQMMMVFMQQMRSSEEKQERIRAEEAKRQERKEQQQEKIRLEEVQRQKEEIQRQEKIRAEEKSEEIEKENKSK